MGVLRGIEMLCNANHNISSSSDDKNKHFTTFPIRQTTNFIHIKLGIECFDKKKKL